MKAFILTISVVCICVVGSTNAATSTNSSEAITLERVIELAEQQHPDLAEAKALVEAAAGRIDQAGKFPNPEAIARMESAPIRGRTTGDAEYLAGVSQLVPLGSRLSKAREVERLEHERRSAELDLKRREVRKRVHAAFATALYQERAYQTQTEIVRSVEKATGTTKARFESGDALREDVARAEMELARAKVELKRAESLHNHALTTLRAAIGDSQARIRSLAGDLDVVFDVPAVESVAAQMTSHPANVAAEAALRVQIARVDLAKVERIPDVKVELLYRRLEAEKRDAFDVGLSIPLPIFDRNQGRVREARAEVEAAQARSRATQNDLNLRLHEAHAQLTTALTNSATFKTEILPRADIVLKAAEARYAAGDISLNEVLPVRRDWAGAQLDYLESLRDVMQAWASLTPLLNDRRTATVR
jgi:outer membrane protein, heavy metal efflux system